MRVSAPANLNAKLEQAGRGAVVCLSGTFSVTSEVRPREGQTLIGPATIRNAARVENGISPKGANARNVTIRNLRVTGFEHRGILCWYGTTARNVELDHNDGNGFGCHMEHDRYGVALYDSHLHHNGQVESSRRVAAAIKFTEAGRPGDAIGSIAIIQNNVIEYNTGNGIWFDNRSSGGLIRGNIVRFNTRNEIRLEVDAGPFLIEGNTVRDPSGSFAGIDVTSTGRAEVRGNDVSVGGPDIQIVEEERAIARYPDLRSDGGYKLDRIIVENNRGQVSGCNQDGVSCR